MPKKPTPGVPTTTIPRLDLDEMDEARLREELGRREVARSKKLCDYCGRTRGLGPPCKLPDRHNGSLEPGVGEYDALRDEKRQFSPGEFRAQVIVAIIEFMLTYDSAGKTKRMTWAEWMNAFARYMSW